MVLSTEELRVAALQASAIRGRKVAKRRIIWRWFAWMSWTFILPVIGLLAIIFSTFVLIFWQYMGDDVVYAVTQKWIQQELRSLPVTTTALQNSKLDGIRLGNVTTESKLNLILERNLMINNKP